MEQPELVEPEVNVVRGAARSGFHTNTLDRALRAGELAFHWQDGRRLIRVADLDEWAARRRAARLPSAAAEARAS